MQNSTTQADAQLERYESNRILNKLIDERFPTKNMAGALREKICTELRINKCVYYSWLYSKTRIPLMALSIIEKIVNAPIFEDPSTISDAYISLGGALADER